MFFPSVNFITNKFVQFWTEISTHKNRCNLKIRYIRILLFMREYSVMNLIKSKICNRMQTKMLK